VMGASRPSPTPRAKHPWPIKKHFFQGASYSYTGAPSTGPSGCLLGGHHFHRSPAQSSLKPQTYNLTNSWQLHGLDAPLALPWTGCVPWNKSLLLCKPQLLLQSTRKHVTHIPRCLPKNGTSLSPLKIGQLQGRRAMRNSPSE
jgi:hypothetical protein